MSYARDLQPKDCTEPVRGAGMIKGRGGGYGFAVSDLERLRRFLILGHEGGTYYASQRALTFETVDCIDRLLTADPTGATVVDQIVEISDSGRAPKNDPAIFALAYVAAKTGTPASLYALANLKKVCRTGTHLFDFLNYSKTLGRGWGTAFKRAVADWYDRSPWALANQVTKYAQRNGWSHRDVCRKSHPDLDPEQNAVIQYVCQRDKWFESPALETDSEMFLRAVEEAKDPKTTNERRMTLILNYRLVREHMPTEALNDVGVWDALLFEMPLTAMLRNLGKMSSIGLVKPFSAASQRICAALADPDQLRAARVHPVSVLIAQRVYGQGRGVKGSLSWSVDQQVMSALEGAFYASFDYVEPTNKRYILGVDVSGSMSSYPCVGTELLKAREAAAVMAMVAVRTEPLTYAFGFSRTFVDLGITKHSSLQDVIQKTSRLPFSSTNVALPIDHALKHGLDVDVFCVYTDNETNCGSHPSTALKRYRDKTGINAKLATFGLAQTNFTVADPKDPGMMDFVGFDAAAPRLLADFATS